MKQVEIPPVEINIKVGDSEYKRDLSSDLLFNEDNLNINLIKQAALFAYYASRQAEAETLVEQFEFETERALANAINTARARMIQEGASRVTDKQLESEAKQDKDYIAWNDSLIEAKNAVRMLKVATRSLEHKREAMGNLSFIKRAEIQAFGTTGGTTIPSIGLPEGTKYPSEY